MASRHEHEPRHRPAAAAAERAGVAAGLMSIANVADVVFLVSTLARSGPTGQLLNIVRYLDRTRFRPHVVTLSPESRSSMAEEFHAIDVDVRSLAMTRLRSVVFRKWRHAMEQLLGFGFDRRVVVHSQGIRADGIVASHLRSVPSIATARNYPYHDYVMKYGGVTGRLMAWKHVNVYRRLPNVVACSASIASLLRAHGVDCGVVRDGIDTGRFLPAAPEQRAAARTRLGLHAGARVGICVGTMSARKDPLSVVRAVRRLPDRDLVMVFVGTGPQEERCRREAGTDERIRFAGHVNDVGPYLRAADFLVSASLSEGLPNAVLEAVACGVRVVLSDIPPHAETLELAPEAGALYRCGDLDELAAAIAAAARDRSSPNPAALEAARRAIDASRMAGEYAELYARLASGSAAAGAHV
jgi:glycosyltransferase involved in cell wall biosynthesis